MIFKHSSNPWTHLHWLTVLAQQGSYTAAAVRLGVSKSAMSQHIADLEKLAGVSLVRRTTRSVRLTDAGQRLVDEVRGPFGQIEHSFSSVSDLAGTPRGRLRVTAPVAFARQQLVPRLADFLHTHPGIKVELMLSDRLSSLASEGFDLAIRHASSLPETHVASSLCRTRSVLVASRAYLRRYPAPQSPAALSAHACLAYPRNHSDSTTWSFARAGAAHPKESSCVVPVTGPFTANNSESLRDAAVAGLGIALLPDFSAQAALKSGKLVTVLRQWRSVDTFADHIYVIRPYASHVRLAVSAFVDFLKTSFADGFPLR